MSDPAPVTNRVADALPNSWVYRLLPESVWTYAQLARWDRPIGWWLLLWPCWWSLAFALSVFTGDEGLLLALLSPPTGGYGWVPFLILFVALLIMLFLMLGAIFMRGAGCTYNDLVDVDLDNQVARTASRPIPSGRVSKRNAWLFLVVQALVGLAVLVVLCLVNPQFGFNTFAFFLGIASLAIVACYPFAKRITDWPQFILGLAFSWGALMGWAVVFGELSPAPLLLYAGCILWVIGYDTIYAHQDKEDDALIGVRSTARLFGDKTKPALVVLYTGTLVLFAMAFSLAGTGWPAYVGLAVGSGHMIWQIMSLDIEDADNCLRLFQSNGYFGWIVFAGLVADLFI